MSSRAQIIATVGPASASREMLRTLVRNGADLLRFNFQWFDPHQTKQRVDVAQAAAKNEGREIKLIADLPGPRVQLAEGHTYNDELAGTVAAHEREMVAFCVQESIPYIAISFVGSAQDVQRYRRAIDQAGGMQRVIAKIERKVAVDALAEIVEAADAVMVARGDLGKEIPIEEIPFVQKQIIEAANAAGKPVIVATQMLLSMTEHQEPTRAEVTDVEEAIVSGADAVMLSEETAQGRFPGEAVAMMERIIVAAEAHRGAPFHLL